MLNRLKVILEYIKNKTLAASTFTFHAVNNFCLSLYRTFIKKNFLSSLIIFSIIVFYQSIISILNFEIAGKEFTFGDDLNYLVETGFAAIWNLFITFIRSFSPSSPIGLALELLTEFIALIFYILGYAISFFLWLIKTTWQLIIKFGIYNVLVVISWLYVIGAIKFIFDKVNSIVELGVGSIQDERNLLRGLLFSKKNKMLENNEDVAERNLERNTNQK
tara:strand:+ start:162 stop:818 length:657 start_codon:yes stop_codon:yes gene_type:complete